VSLSQGEVAVARTIFETSLVTMREFGDQVGIANALNGLGTVAYWEDDYSAAWAFHQEALAIRRQLADRRGIASSLNNLGLVARRWADYPAARALIGGEPGNLSRTGRSKRGRFLSGKSGGHRLRCR
jgi:hypothetical protein